MTSGFPTHPAHLRFERQSRVPGHWDHSEAMLRAWVPNWLANALARMLGGLG